MTLLLGARYMPKIFIYRITIKSRILDLMEISVLKAILSLINLIKMGRPGNMMNILIL